MRPVSATTTIDAPREVVHGLLLDLSARPAFTDHFLDEFRLLRMEPVGVGAGARFRVGGTQGWMDSVISESDAPHIVREAGHGGRLNQVPTHTVWELADAPGPGGCEVSVTFWTEPGTRMQRMRERGLERKMRAGWRRAMPRLKDAVEDDGEIDRVHVGGTSALAF